MEGHCQLTNVAVSNVHQHASISTAIYWCSILQIDIIISKIHIHTYIHTHMHIHIFNSQHIISIIYGSANMVFNNFVYTLQFVIVNNI